MRILDIARERPEFGGDLRSTRVNIDINAETTKMTGEPQTDESDIGQRMRNDAGSLISQDLGDLGSVASSISRRTSEAATGRGSVAGASSVGGSVFRPQVREYREVEKERKQQEGLAKKELALATRRKEGPERQLERSREQAEIEKYRTSEELRGLGMSCWKIPG